MRVSIGSLVLLFAFASATEALPLTVGGFTFVGGEAAFADSATVVSGTVTGATATQVNDTLVGSSVGDSIRVITPDVAVIEVQFIGNAIENGSGTDLVILELSGSAPPAGFADVNERFDVSLFVSGTFSAFVEVVPVSTGVIAPHDPSLAVYAVEIDLGTFGVVAGGLVDRVRIRLVDHLVTRSADPTAFGALHSVPEPSATLSTMIALLLSLLEVRHCLAWTRARSS